jgi:hypothetical protein
VEVIDIPVSRVSTDASTKDQHYIDGGHVKGGPASYGKDSPFLAAITSLESGATPDAIRLLSKATGTFTKKEEKEMAEKLKAKGAAKAPKSANTDELKEAAKSAPVAAKDAPAKRKGNPEALAKARAARQTGPDNRKIKGLVKAKDLTAREGSTRRKMLEDLLSSKTVQEFRDKGYSAGDLNYATSAGVVSVS